MAGIKLLKPGEYFPAGVYSSTVVGDFRVEPVPGEAWRAMVGQTAGVNVFRGRFVTKAAGMTNFVVQISSGSDAAGQGKRIAGAYGAGVGGLEAGILTVTSTTLVNANTWMMPNFRLLFTGTAGSNDTDARAVMLFGFPVKAIHCVSAIAGMPWAAGDDLMDPNKGRLEWQ